MKICIMANARAVHTRRWALAFTDRGHEVVVLSIRATTIPGVTVRTVCIGKPNAASRWLSLLSYIRLALQAKGILRSLGPDIVNAHFTITHGVIAALSGYRPRVVSAWGSDVLTAGRSPMGFWSRWMNRWACTSADRVLSTSHFMADEMRRSFLSSGTPIIIIPYGVDPTVFRPGTTEESRDPADPPLTIGFVKTLSENYAPDLLIRAFASALARGLDARLVLAGRGPLQGTLEALSKQLEISDRVSFLGFVPHENVPSLMRKLDILVNCSRSESFGVVICEASASGIPVIVTDVGGVREVVKDGVTGRLIPPDDLGALADAMVQLGRCPEQRLAMGQAGRKFIEDTYVWSNNVDAVLQCFETLRNSRLQ